MSTGKQAGWTGLTTTVAAAFVLWFLTFYFEWGNFWLKISLSSAVLAVSSLCLWRREIDWRFRAWDIPLACGAAFVLYLIFYAGDTVSARIMEFAPEQVGSIYDRGEGTPSWTIFVLLFFVTSPAEEIYWRGFLQENLSRRLGPLSGWLLATLFYALVHLPAWNFMLIGAAAVAGAFWGLLYWRLRRVIPLIICHAVWSVTIFALLPIR